MKIGKGRRAWGREKKNRETRRRPPRGRSDSREAICFDAAATPPPQVMVALRPAGSCFERSTHAAVVDDVV